MTKSTASTQLRPQPHIAGIAATTAANGIVTNAHSAMITPSGCLPVVNGLGVGPPASVEDGSSVTVDMGSLFATGFLRLRNRNLGWPGPPRADRKRMRLPVSEGTRLGVRSAVV